MELLEALQKRLKKRNGAHSLRGRRKTMDKRKKIQELMEVLQQMQNVEDASNTKEISAIQRDLRKPPVSFFK